MDFFVRLFGGKKRKGETATPAKGFFSPPSPVAARIAALFKPLDKAQDRLAQDIADFIAEDRNGSVLSTLATQQIRSFWEKNRLYWQINRDCKTAFSPGVMWDDGQLARLGDVLAAIHPLGGGQEYGILNTAKAPDWLRHLITSMCRLGRKICSVDALERLLATRGLGADIVLDIVFSPDPANYRGDHCIGHFEGVDSWLATHTIEVNTAAEKMAAGPRTQLAAAIGRFQQIDSYLDLLIDCGVSTAKSVREAAQKSLTGADSQRLIGQLEMRYATAAPGVRGELITLASRALGHESVALLETWRAGEQNAKTRAVLERILSGMMAIAPNVEDEAAEGSVYRALDGSVVEIPPMPAIPERATLSRATLDLLTPTIRSFNAALEKAREEARAERWHWSKSHKFLDGGAMSAMLDACMNPTHGRSDNPFGWMQVPVKLDPSGIDAFFSSPDLSLRHLVYIVRRSTHLDLLMIFNAWVETPAVTELRRRIQGGADLRVVNVLWREAGGSEGIRDHLANQWGSAIENFPAETLWPLIAENFDLIEEGLGFRPQSGVMPLYQGAALDMLGALPKVPQRFLAPLMSVATGSRRALRIDARRLLAGAPDIDDAIALMLSDGKQEVRAGAAEWLGQRGAKAHIQSLRQALKAEKSDLGRAAIISALERLGDDLSDIFDPVKMKADAEAGLGKSSTKGLEWFPMDGLPGLTWRDGKAVDPVLVRWWVVLSHKLKQPGGNALIDLWLERLTPGDAHRLGRYVLTAWIEQDTRTMTQDEANAYALSVIDAQLSQNQAFAKRNPAYASYYITDRDQLFTRIRNEKLSTYLGSAVDSKGVLALTSQVEGADMARLGRGYLKNHGSRVSQAKAILDALASNPSGAAIQIVLATANRFKARTVQAHAAALIDDISSRRGWTPEELADRTIPTAGLDETGVAELDCGIDRTYRLVLDAQDDLVLLNPGGTAVKALPAARVDEEKPLLDEAKKALATARKEIKQVMPDQSARLREAMCLERKWSAEDWRLYVLGHPLVARLARRLVWMGLDGEGGLVTTFRPLDDNSLSDCDDRTVDPAGFALVQLAHCRLVPDAVSQAWNTHLADYEVKPPFDQFRQDLPVFDPALQTRNEINDRKGWMIETFKLRGAANKLGYVRSQAEDGGYFTTYERRYTGAGLVALIHFSGSPLPEENLQASLRELSFAQLLRNSAWYGKTMALTEVPPVLLTETWQDLRDIAAKGTGFDPQWEKKTPW